MRTARASVLGTLLLAAAQAPAAEEAAAPLESTKQELRQLESAQKNKAGDVAGGVRVSAPVMEVRSDESSTIRMWKMEQKEKEARRQQELKQREASNWLVNGVEQLGKEGTKPDETKDGQASATGTGTLGATRDPSDPQYLLKLFDDQKKQSDPKESSAKLRSTPAPDPFAPFLQGWLGNSPVRDQVMEQFKRGNEAGGVSLASGGGNSPDFRPPAVVSAGGNGPAPLQTAGEAKPNPYLVELNAPIPAREALGGTATMPAADPTLPSGLSAALVPQTTPLVDPLPDLRAPAKGPPPGLTDDKKYFPQQKKF